ncbi:hypothetical protein C0Q70_20062 [Pomacea canaliculata]|uniref:Amino acid permease/ SLC12A domain-containing protein n=1 Tax=Pomacea canaliculata TaxID=400727 RepID=A0A2T7NEL8_POMCA|nr:hypothetical protein C0Q70_20062 [Pomacea canaliculata]
MLFLRLTWMTGQAGIGLASVIVLISSLVTTLTTMSMAAICTNGEVKGGGAYYMISRSLGPEFGGAIGVIFSLANAVAASMHAVGFAETLRDLLYKYDIAITGDLLHDVRVIASGTMVLLLIIVLIGLDFESKAQLVLLVILIVSLFNYFIGTFLPPSEEKRRVGFVGYHGSVFLQNVGPDFRESDGTDYDFFKIFAIYFPSATGILAGANISGDLKNPSKAIPRGTFLAILITTIVYLAIVWTCGSCMVRDAVGAAVANASNMSLTLEDIQTCGNVSCSFGLQNSHAIMGVASAYGPLIYAGAFSATLSSSLACLVSAPKVFQALAKDKLFPFIGIFGKGYGKGGEPRPGYILTFVICVGMSCIGSLDIIAPIISNFFLMAYALINFSCFDAAFANSPGFRPSFHFFNKWLSLLGALICLVIMFLLKWWAALATVIMVSGLYVFLVRRKPDVNWGSSAQAHAYNDALKSTLSLMNVNEHVKNFRPQILALTGYPRNRPALVDFTSCITKRQSLLVCGHVFVGDMQRHVRHLRSTAAYRWFSNRDVRAFYSSLAAPTIRHGVQVLLQSQGLGKLRPNTLLMGFKTNWQTAEPPSVHNYVGIIHDAFDLHYGVGILRVPGGLDTHKVSDDLLDATDDTLEGLDEDNVSMEEGAGNKDKDKTSGGLTEPSGNDVSLKTFKHSQGQGHVNNGYIDDLVNDTRDPRPAQSSALSKCESSDDAPSFNRFRGKQQGTIDVWWLFDDGGLGLLVPYLLSTRKQWKNCKLRVFCAGTKRSNIDADHRQMATLLNKLRIDCSEITVVPDLRTKPKRSSYKEFEEVIYQWRLKGGEFQDDYPWKVSDADLASHKEKIYMQIKIREKLLEFSKDASLIVVTLPVPRKFCPSGLYMAWLDTLSRDLPPTLLLRGNQQSVLTFTS